MDSMLILMKLVGVACVGAGGALLLAQVLRVDRWFEWLSRRESSTLRLSIAGLGLAGLAGALCIVAGVVPVDFTRVAVGAGLWLMIAAPMVAWPLLTTGREPHAASRGEVLPLPRASSEQGRRAA